MKNKRIIRGRAVLVCGETQTAVTYRLELTSDRWGNQKATGLLNEVDPAVAFMSSQVPLCRLILEGGQEFDVNCTVVSDGSVQVKSSGRIPGVD